MYRLFRMRRQKTLLMWVLAFTALNIGLVGVFYEQTRGQIQNREMDRNPIKVRVETLSGSPITIVMQYVDTSGKTAQDITLTLRNNSDTTITGLGLLVFGEKEKTQGSIVTGDLSLSPLLPGAEITQVIPIDATLIDREKSFVVLSDLVVFEGGKTWGPDSNGRLEVINASKQGRSAALNDLEDALRKGMRKSVESIPSFTIFEDSSKSDSWNRSYVQGYGSTVDLVKNWISQNPSSDLTVKIKQIRELHARDQGRVNQ